MKSSSDPPGLSKSEAQASLNEIERVILQTRKSIAHSSAAPLLFVWGTIWVIGYCGSDFFPSNAPWIWLALAVLGGGASWLAGWYFRSPVKGPHDGRIGMFWAVLFVYAAIWMWLLGLSDLASANGRTGAAALTARFGAYWATIPMFAYVVGGLWLGKFFVWLGATVTALTLLGFCVLPAHFSLWMAVTGGGALIFSGLFIRKFWR